MSADDELPIPELPAGFIEIVHPDLTGAPCVVPEDSFGVYAARGWVRADEAPAVTVPASDALDADQSAALAAATQIDEVTPASDEQEESA